MTEARSLPIPPSRRNRITRVPCVLPADSSSNYYKTFGHEVSPSSSLKYSNSNTTTSNSSLSSTLDQSYLTKITNPSSRYPQHVRPSCGGRVMRQMYEPTDVNRKYVFFESRPHSQVNAGGPSLALCSSSNSNSPSNSYNGKYRRYLRNSMNVNYPSQGSVISPATEVEGFFGRRSRIYFNKLSFDHTNRNSFSPSPVSSRFSNTPAMRSPYSSAHKLSRQRVCSQSDLCQASVGQKRKLNQVERGGYNARYSATPSQNRIYSSNLNLNICNDPVMQRKKYVETEKVNLRDPDREFDNTDRTESFPLRKAASAANLEFTSSFGLFDAAKKAELLSQKYEQNYENIDRSKIFGMVYNNNERNSRSFESDDFHRNKHNNEISHVTAISASTSNLVQLLENNKIKELEGNLTQFADALKDASDVDNAPVKSDAINFFSNSLLQQAKGLEDEALSELDKVLESCAPASFEELSTSGFQESAKSKSIQNGVDNPELNYVVNAINSSALVNEECKKSENDTSVKLYSSNQVQSLYEPIVEKVQEENLISDFGKSLDSFCKSTALSADIERKMDSKKPMRLNLEISEGLRSEKNKNSGIRLDETDDFLRRCRPYMQPPRREIVFTKPQTYDHESENSVDLSEESI